ncbi:MAG TPA: class I SAM-dependent methyltransferase [Terriglobales bacterium]|jgi:SAM-dependent methyltransferase
MRLFRSSSREEANQNAPAQRMSRRSNGLGEVAKVLAREEQLCILDLGATSANNIRFFTERGHKIYSEDLLEASTDPALATTDEQGKPILDSKQFLTENLRYPNGQFDVILCWNFPDYLDESLVKPVVEKLWSVLKPGGFLLAFFHTKEAGPDAVCYRYHVMGGDTLEMQPIELQKHGRGGSIVRLQRVFNNRHIENLFRDFGSIKFFLSRDNIREVLVVR